MVSYNSLLSIINPWPFTKNIMKHPQIYAPLHNLHSFLTSSQQLYHTFQQPYTPSMNLHNDHFSINIQHMVIQLIPINPYPNAPTKMPPTKTQIQYLITSNYVYHLILNMPPQHHYDVLIYENIMHIIQYYHNYLFYLSIYKHLSNPPHFDYFHTILLPFDIHHK